MTENPKAFFVPASTDSNDYEVHVSTYAASRKRPGSGVSAFRKLIVYTLAVVALTGCLTAGTGWFGKTTLDFSHLTKHCAHLGPIPAQSYIARQDELARLLHNLNASAYIAEPGANAAYFGNLSLSHWHLSERPLLLVITPARDEYGSVRANLSVLTPSFEATRAKLLPIPSASNITYLEWPEDVNPYSVAMHSLSGSSAGKIFVDNHIRHFIVDGLQEAAISSVNVVSAPVAIRQLRERKSGEELELLKCANEVTVLSIRSAREHMYLGMRESQARSLVEQAMKTAGLNDPFALTLFGENAALPHGSGTDRLLGPQDLILIDCGGSLHGYESDVTRTFALPESKIPPDHICLWNYVRQAQTIALNAARNGTITAEVDNAAREFLRSKGYAQYFTHRLGHGIGLEGHESPYLTGGTNDTILTGQTFSDEPGIYIESKVGVRLEDCFFIDDSGQGRYLTEGIGGQSSSPWQP
ncbi:peptidase M24 [Panus rudis PR-1116 ss-1]|nr:peptidase M24 [Panus rudis PR-1116 ss-1]